MMIKVDIFCGKLTGSNSEPNTHVGFVPIVKVHGSVFKVDPNEYWNLYDKSGSAGTVKLSDNVLVKSVAFRACNSAMNEGTINSWKGKGAIVSV